MEVSQYTVIIIIVSCALVFTEYCLTLIGYFCLLRNKELPQKQLKFEICTLIAVQCIGLILVNSHEGDSIINDVICQVQAVLLVGTTLSISIISGCLAYQRMRTDIPDNLMLMIIVGCFLSIIIPFFLGDLQPEGIYCEMRREILWIIYIAVPIAGSLLMLLISMVHYRNSWDGYLRWYALALGVGQFSLLISIATQKAAGQDTQYVDFTLICLALRDIICLCLFIAEAREQFMSFCSVQKKSHQVVEFQRINN